MKCHKARITNSFSTRSNYMLLDPNSSQHKAHMLGDAKSRVGHISCWYNMAQSCYTRSMPEAPNWAEGLVDKHSKTQIVYKIWTSRKSREDKYHLATYILMHKKKDKKDVSSSVKTNKTESFMNLGSIVLPVCPCTSVWLAAPEACYFRCGSMPHFSSQICHS